MIEIGPNLTELLKMNSDNIGLLLIMVGFGFIIWVMTRG